MNLSIDVISGWPGIARVGDDQLRALAVDAADRRRQPAHVHEHVVVIERAVQHRRAAVHDLLGAGQRQPEHVRHRLAPEAVAVAVTELADVVVGHALVGVPGAAGGDDRRGIEVEGARRLVEDADAGAPVGIALGVAASRSGSPWSAGSAAGRSSPLSSIALTFCTALSISSVTLWNIPSAAEAMTMSTRGRSSCARRNDLDVDDLVAVVPDRPGARAGRRSATRARPRAASSRRPR